MQQHPVSWQLHRAQAPALQARGDLYRLANCSSIWLEAARLEPWSTIKTAGSGLLSTLGCPVLVAPAAAAVGQCPCAPFARARGAVARCLHSTGYWLAGCTIKPGPPVSLAAGQARCMLWGVQAARVLHRSAERSASDLYQLVL